MRNGMLYKKTEKKDSWVVIPLRQEAHEIFIRHFKDGIPKISNIKFNKYIKIIAAIAGITELITFSYKRGNKDIVQTKSKAQLVTSHTCRWSFTTNEYLNGVEVNLIKYKTQYLIVSTHSDSGLSRHVLNYKKR